MIFIGMGANLPSSHGGPVETIRQALRLLEVGGDRILRQSRWYESAPVPISDQPWYVNAVAEIGSTRDAAGLLSRLHEVENSLGRVRGELNAARQIDLDLLDYNGLRSDGWPILPHPRMDRRTFVLRPLADLAPDWRHPKTDRTIPDLLAEIEFTQTTRVLKVTGP
jgi:2-amino-4-hydroxy-6-hydroxymethyldihydropteridine diphosphokinase